VTLRHRFCGKLAKIKAGISLYILLATVYFSNLQQPLLLFPLTFVHQDHLIVSFYGQLDQLCEHFQSRFQQDSKSNNGFIFMKFLFIF